MTKFQITNVRQIRKNSLVGSFAMQEWTKQDGTKGYFPLLEFASREISDKFQTLVRPLAEKALGF
jgi:hypothetical protein